MAKLCWRQPFAQCDDWDKSFYQAESDIEELEWRRSFRLGDEPKIDRFGSIFISCSIQFQ